MEVFNVLLRDGVREADARDTVRALQPHLINFSFEDVLDAMAIRDRMNRKRRSLSYVDAVGYHLARKHHLRFLTRDPRLRGLPGVLVP